MSRARSCSGVALLTALALAACGDDDRPGFIIDGSLSDVGFPDGNAGDASSDGDAGDASPDGGALVNCVVGEVIDVVSAPGTDADTHIELAAGASEAMLVVRGLTEGTTGAQVFAYRLSGDTVSSGTPLAPSPNDDVLRPNVVTRDGAYLAGFSMVPSAGNPRQIFSRGVDADGDAIGTTPTQLSSTTGGEDHLALLARADDTTLAVYQTGASGVRALLVDHFEGEDVVLAGPTTIDASGIRGRTVLAHIGSQAFAAYRATNGRIHTVALNVVESMASISLSAGTPNAISNDETDTGPNFDFDGYDDDGGIIFEYIVSAGLRTEVWYQPINPSGQAPQGEVRLSGSIAQGHAPSLGKIGGGYLVAYRHVEDSMITLRLLLIDEFGMIVDMDHGPTLSSISGDVRVRVANDGTPYIVYEEPTMVPDPEDETMTMMVEGTVVRYLQVTCS